jgi:RecB family exonuclease
MPSQNETPFKFKIGNNIIRGRYDAIFSSERGTSIVDFKTSNIKTQLDADKKTKESKQLATYALAWFKNHNQVPDSVHLYYVETGLVGQHQPTLKQIEKTEAELEKACDGIRSREFEATPNIKACGFCPYKFYCPDAVTEKVAT